MRKKFTLVFVAILFIFSMTSMPEVTGYSSEIQSGRAVTWQIESAPENAFNMYYTGGGNWIAQEDSMIGFEITDFDDDVRGLLSIGNVSVQTNDTDIAKDLTLGVWGTPTQWWPGLFVKVGQSDIESLNSTAYGSAERVSGNYLNGTMISSYETINANNEQHQCIVFDYEQDPSGFGEPQRTHLAYSLDTGILIEANTTYSFGTPYELVFRFTGIVEVTVVDLIADPTTFIAVSGLVGGAILAVIVVAYIKLRRSN